MKCHSLDRIFTLLALCCGGLFTGAQDVGDKSQVSPSQRDLSLRDQVNIHVKNAPRVVVFVSLARSPRIASSRYPIHPLPRTNEAMFLSRPY